MAQTQVLHILLAEVVVVAGPKTTPPLLREEMEVSLLVAAEVAGLLALPVAAAPEVLGVREGLLSSHFSNASN
jgi:hypothetical protein